MFEYQPYILRGIEESYHTAMQNGIEFYVRGFFLWREMNRLSIAEYRCDYSRACEYVGVKPGVRTNHFNIIKMTRFLNGED